MLIVFVLHKKLRDISCAFEFHGTKLFTMNVNL